MQTEPLVSLELLELLDNLVPQELLAQLELWARLGRQAIQALSGPLDKLETLELLALPDLPELLVRSGRREIRGRLGPWVHLGRLEPQELLVRPDG